MKGLIREFEKKKKTKFAFFDLREIFLNVKKINFENLKLKKMILNLWN